MLAAIVSRLFCGCFVITSQDVADVVSMVLRGCFAFPRLDVLRRRLRGYVVIAVVSLRFRNWVARLRHLCCCIVIVSRLFCSNMVRGHPAVASGLLFRGCIAVVLRLRYACIVGASRLRQG